MRSTFGNQSSFTPQFHPARRNDHAPQAFDLCAAHRAYSEVSFMNNRDQDKFSNQGQQQQGQNQNRPGQNQQGGGERNPGQQQQQNPDKRKDMDPDVNDDRNTR
jgi:hypothetical protein